MKGLKTENDHPLFLKTSPNIELHKDYYSFCGLPYLNEGTNFKIQFCESTLYVTLNIPKNVCYLSKKISVLNKGYFYSILWCSIAITLIYKDAHIS